MPGIQRECHATMDLHHIAIGVILAIYVAQYIFHRYFLIFGFRLLHSIDYIYFVSVSKHRTTGTALVCLVYFILNIGLQWYLELHLHCAGGIYNSNCNIMSVANVDGCFQKSLEINQVTLKNTLNFKIKIPH